MNFATLFEELEPQTDEQPVPNARHHDGVVASRREARLLQSPMRRRQLIAVVQKLQRRPGLPGMLAQVRDLCAPGRLILEGVVKSKNEPLDGDDSIRIGLRVLSTRWPTHKSKMPGNGGRPDRLEGFSMRISHRKSIVGDVGELRSAIATGRCDPCKSRCGVSPVSWIRHRLLFPVVDSV
jgi:hypothetical protein